MAKATSDGIQLKVKGWVDYTRLYHCQDIVIRALIRWIKEESKSLENVTFENEGRDHKVWSTGGH
jgi:hypothetical protein